LKDPLPVKLGREISSDFTALPSEALRRRVLQLLVDLRTKPYLGQKLVDHPTLGDLSDCRKVYFDATKTQSPRFRIVYRLQPTETAPTSIDIVVIGQRGNAAVYHEALRRLGRGLT
jgi:hypothetical protein